jgi:hypothetical protein
MDRPLVGKILSHGKGLHFSICLENGDSITAVLPLATIRSLGMIHVDALIGSKVQVVLRSAPKRHRIVKLERPKD